MRLRPSAYTSALSSYPFDQLRVTVYAGVPVGSAAALHAPRLAAVMRAKSSAANRFIMRLYA
jgi:hypothetical protein